MHMLPEGTTTTGFWVFRASVEPNQKPKNMRMIKPMIVAVWMYSFFQSFLSAVVNGLPSCGWVVLLWLRGFCGLKVYRWLKGKMRGELGR